MGFQLVLEAELLPTAVTFIGLLPGVDAFVALQRALISKAAPAELTLIWVVPCWNAEKKEPSLLHLQTREKGNSTTVLDWRAEMWASSECLNKVKLLWQARIFYVYACIAFASNLTTVGYKHTVSRHMHCYLNVSPDYFGGFMHNVRTTGVCAVMDTHAIRH